MLAPGQNQDETQRHPETGELHAATVPRVGLLCHLENSNLGGIGALGRNGQVKPAQVRREEGGASAAAGGDLLLELIAVGVALADDVNKTAATGEVEPFARGVVEQVVRIIGDGQIR